MLRIKAKLGSLSLGMQQNQILLLTNTLIKASKNIWVSKTIFNFSYDNFSRIFLSLYNVSCYITIKNLSDKNSIEFSDIFSYINYHNFSSFSSVFTFSRTRLHWLRL